MSQFTLKIYWTRRVTRTPEPPAPTDDISTGPTSLTMTVTSVEDEKTLFIAADQVCVHGIIGAGERASQMRHWHDQADAPGYLNYLSVESDQTGEEQEEGGRLICVTLDGKQTWYLASTAWLLGPDGGTIERVAP